MLPLDLKALHKAAASSQQANEASPTHSPASHASPINFGSQQHRRLQQVSQQHLHSSELAASSYDEPLSSYAVQQQQQQQQQQLIQQQLLKQKQIRESTYANGIASDSELTIRSHRPNYVASRQYHAHPVHSPVASHRASSNQRPQQHSGYVNSLSGQLTFDGGSSPTGAQFASVACGLTSQQSPRHARAFKQSMSIDHHNLQARQHPHQLSSPPHLRVQQQVLLQQQQQQPQPQQYYKHGSGSLVNLQHAYYSQQQQHFGPQQQQLALADLPPNASFSPLAPPQHMRPDSATAAHYPLPSKAGASRDSLAAKAANLALYDRSPIRGADFKQVNAAMRYEQQQHQAHLRHKQSSPQMLPSAGRPQHESRALFKHAMSIDPHALGGLSSAADFYPQPRSQAPNVGLHELRQRSSLAFGASGVAAAQATQSAPLAPQVGQQFEQPTDARQFRGHPPHEAGNQHSQAATFQSLSASSEQLQQQPQRYQQQHQSASCQPTNAASPQQSAARKLTSQRSSGSSGSGSLACSSHAHASVASRAATSASDDYSGANIAQASYEQRQQQHQRFNLSGSQQQLTFNVDSQCGAHDSNSRQVSNATKVASVSPTPTKPALVQQSFLLRKQQSGDASNSGGEMSEQSDVTNNATSTANNSADNISGLSKKSSSATQLSMTGTKKRLGFRKKQVTSFSVHRSEEVAPIEASHLIKQHSSISDSSLSGENASKQLSWSQSNLKLQFDTNSANSASSFVQGLGKGQMISRQELASPYLGDIQLSLCDRRGNLEVDVIRARNLSQKLTYKALPLTYVKLYLVKNRKCLAKLKTTLSSKRSLDPLFQQLLTFHEDYRNCILQAIVWANYSKMDKKRFLGIVQISIDDLELGDTVISWYKLFLPSSLLTMPSKSLRHTLLSTSTESFAASAATTLQQSTNNANFTS